MTKDINNYHFFWKGVLSNWATTPFYMDIEGKLLKFGCAEQAMMYFKALLFNDATMAHFIAKTTNPKEVKALGRKVKNFDSNIWDANKYRIVKAVLTSKFGQCKGAYNELMKHKSKIFVEASPYDTIWGIGYSERDALENKDKWGENLLGKILTELSNEL